MWYGKRVFNENIAQRSRINAETHRNLDVKTWLGLEGIHNFVDRATL